MNEDHDSPEILAIATTAAALSFLFVLGAIAVTRFIQLLVGDETWLWAVIAIAPLTIFCVAYWVERFTAK